MIMKILKKVVVEKRGRRKRNPCPMRLWSILPLLFDFTIGFWNCSDWLVFHYLHLLHILKILPSPHRGPIHPATHCPGGRQVPSTLSQFWYKQLEHVW